MVVQHNLTAMNANRMLGITTGQQAKSSEKLSSGYRINRAADDAAGLTISEKMRKQIKGLDQASTNAQDGVSAVQTAEGALTEVHSMLQRMNELAVQASNGTNSKGDRDAIQAEIDQLTTEIDRVAETTKFNETYLLKGDGSPKTNVLNAHDAGIKGSLVDNGDTATFTAGVKGIGDKISIGGTEYTIVGSKDAADFTDINKYTDAKGDKIVRNDVTYTYDGADWKDAAGATLAGGLKKGDTLISNGKSTTLIGATGADTKADTLENIKAAMADNGVTGVEINGKAYTLAPATDAANSKYTLDDLAALIKDGDNVKVTGGAKAGQYFALPKDSKNPNEISLNEAYDKIAKELEKASNIGADAATPATVKNNGDGTFEITKGKVQVDNALSFSLHVGADADMTNKINVSIDTMSAAGLGVKGINVSDENGTAATYAIDAIADAVATVSSQRSALGAVQNRLEHTIANLDNVVENTTAAESRIRDTDMAEEMVEYSKNNILAQAGQSMLAQANQSTQGVLSLLQ